MQTRRRFAILAPCRRAVGLLGLCALLAVLPALAQRYRTGYAGEVLGSSSIATVRGTVQDLDFLKGAIAIRSNGRVWRLHAHPQDLAGLNPGDVAALTYGNYGGQLWLEPGGGDASGSYGAGFGAVNLDTFAISGEVTGTVQSVNRSAGTLRVADHTLRAHPEQLSGLYPGAFVSVGYAQIGSQRWLDSMDGTIGYGSGAFDLGGGLYELSPAYRTPGEGTSDGSFSRGGIP